MCGISGFLECNTGNTEDSFKIIIEKMNATLVHRGPDNSGCWYDIEAGIALGHRRLSIIDLSPEGNEPMISASGRYVITYNGEIYNYRELRRELETAGWHCGNSDTSNVSGFENWVWLVRLSVLLECLHLHYGIVRRDVYPWFATA